MLLATTMRTLPRIITILFNLGPNKVRQLAITTVFLSSVSRCFFGTLTAMQLAMTVKTLVLNSAVLFNVGTNKSGYCP